MKAIHIALIIYQLIAISNTEDPFWADIPRRHEKHFSRGKPKTRYHWRDVYVDQTTIEEPDLSVTFQPPHYEAPDYWHYEHQKYYESDRRPFFEDRFHPKHETNTPPNFYRFTGSLFKEQPKPSLPELTFRQKYSHTTPSDHFGRSHGFRHNDINYIPPPKPIRASVVKLETIPRSFPLHPSSYYDSATKHSHYLGSILNQALIESFKQQHYNDLSFHSLPISKVTHDSFTSTAVLPRPGNVPPTTLKPVWIHPRNFNNHTLQVHEEYYFEKPNETNNKYPHSVQDQLPPTNLKNIKIPYLPETTIDDIFTNLPVSNTPAYEIYAKNYYPSANTPSSTTDSGLSWLGPNPTKENTVTQTYPTTFFPQFTSRPKPPHKASIERITNLTLEGLSKIKQKPVNIHDYVNQLEVRNLIPYEMSKLERTTQESENFSKPSTATILNNASDRSINLNDELSLDAKILKDTQWDGFTTTKPSKTTVLVLNITEVSSVARETITDKTLNTQNISNEPIIVHNASYTPDERNQTTLYPIPTEPTVIELLNFTEIVSLTSTTNEPSTIKEGFNKTLEQEYETKQETTEKAFTEEPVLRFVDTTATTARRKYNRRPKVTNFTPYPTPTELQNKVINRNYYLKRQKPNITLAFGNKNITKTKKTTYSRDEVIRFSDEDIAKRTKKGGKRRQLVKRKRITTTEATIVNVR